MHKLRIRNPNDTALAKGTEVWLDDFRLDGVTHVYFGAEAGGVCEAAILINVRDVDIEAPAHLQIEVENFGPYYRARAALEELIAKAKDNRATVEEVLAALVELKTTSKVREP